jgi:hypothetical protein
MPLLVASDFPSATAWTKVAAFLWISYIKAKLYKNWMQISFMNLEARNFQAILDEPISNSGERCLVVLTKFRQDISWKVVRGFSGTQAILCTWFRTALGSMIR